MKKIKQLANNAFVRSDRTEVLSEGLLEAERRIDQIKHTCETTAKKVNACLQGQGKDGTALDKRIRKVPEFILGSVMIENGKQLGDGSVLGEVLAESGQIEMKLGQAVVEFEVKIEDLVLKPLQQLMDNDLPNIYKLKRQLSKYTADMDTARAKLQQASRHSMTGGQAGKIDNIKEEWEETQQKVEQCRDNLAAEMYALIARESEISRVIVDFLNYQKEYHQSVSSILIELISGVESCITTSVHKPVYGLPLDEHLRTTQKTIAYPIELCICGLLETALEEEGIFRIAGSSSKVKKLKSAFDAGLMNLRGLLAEFCDPHVIANALKCYFRELPEPLLTFDLYNDWMNAIRTADHNEKSKALWTVIQRLPKTNYDNLRYLVKFLSELSSHQSVNKMSSANIAIVIAPNLLWCNANTSAEDLMGDNNQMGLNMTMTHHYSSVLEHLVTYCSYFFPDDIDFYISCERPTEQELEPTINDRSSKSIVNGGTVGNLIDESSSSEDHNQSSSQIKRSHSNSSVDEHSPPHGSPKPVIRRKNKPAPVPPIQLQGNRNPLANANSTTASKPPSCPANPSVFMSEKVSESQYNNSSTSQARSSAKRSIVSSDSFKGSAASTKEKREAVWIPPSPRETSRKKMLPAEEDISTGSPPSVSMGPPSKPPPPVGYHSPKSSIDFSSRLNKVGVTSGSGNNNDPPPKPASPLRHKSSFKSSSVESTTTTTSSPLASPIRNHTTDNIENPPVNSNPSAFASLPRHFHTENSFKNQRAPRPPSMWGMPPPAPPQGQSKEVNPTPTSSLPPEKCLLAQPEKEESMSLQIGFEKLETDIRKNSLPNDEFKSNPDSSLNKLKQDNKKETKEQGNNEGQEMDGVPAPMSRPVPAPRSSLLSQSHSFSHGTAEGKDKDVPVVRERPSLMAKPRDLTRRHNNTQSTLLENTNHFQFIDGKGAKGDDLEEKEQDDSVLVGSGGGQKASQVGIGKGLESKGSAAESEDSSESGYELTKNNGVGKQHGGDLPPQSPSGLNSTNLNRPPRPHPPAPPKVRVSNESTDL